MDWHLCRRDYIKWLGDRIQREVDETTQKLLNERLPSSAFSASALNGADPDLVSTQSK